MNELLLQVQIVPTDGVHIDPAWVVATGTALLSMLTGTITFLYRGQIQAMKDRIAWLEQEGKRKDERTDRLIQQIGRVANVTERSVSLAEREHERARR